MKTTKKVTIRFRDFPDRNSCSPFVALVKMATLKEVEVVEHPRARVDIEITGPYSGDSDDFTSPFFIKATRGILAKSTYGSHVSMKKLATGIRPNPSAKRNIWYSGENQRPPFGEWDGYLSFDTKLPGQKNFYLPLWWITSTDLFGDISESYWGCPNPTVDQLAQPRTLERKKTKFACAFIGKNYRTRLHALESLQRIGKVDVFGGGVHRFVEKPYEIAKRYKFALCFENDLYPGYVTEKPLEAYLCGTIPLYNGIDCEGYLNSNAMLNLHEYSTLDSWLDRISSLNSDVNLYRTAFEEPILKKKPNLGALISALREMMNLD